jgi:hypothetical protein
VPTYRAYLLDPDGRIRWGEWIEAADQAEAERLAQAMCDAGTPTIELWQGRELLGELPCEPHAAPPPKRRAGR